jgi:hypothetical protein
MGEFMKKLFVSALVFLPLFFTGCGKNLEEKGSKEYITEINEWHFKRTENLKKENGWLNLVGLFWLEQGENTFGTNANNKLVFPTDRGYDFMGKLILEDSTVILEPNENAGIKINGNNAGRVILKDDMSGIPDMMEYGSLKWFIIKRGEKIGVRLRDLNAPLLILFSGIERFPVNSDWRLEAEFIPYNPPKKLLIPTVIGTIEEELSPGAIKFKKDGKEFRLDVQDAGKQYFTVLADLTSGKETYGGGRFLYVEKPDSTSNFFIDFNKAYNPPCVFTKYATCPLPTKENYLKLEITAGEKNYGEGH